MKKLYALLGFTLMLVILAGCTKLIGGPGTPPTRYYIISPLVESESNQIASDGGREISIAIEPVLLPPYLDRPQIVIQTGENELNFSEFNQWGEDLRTNISRVLIENLSMLLGSERIYIMPGLKRQKPDFRALIRIIRFERGDDGVINLTVRWKLNSQDGKQVIFRENMLLTGETVAQGDYPAIVRAMSNLLAEFTQRIAKTIGLIPLPKD